MKRQSYVLLSTEDILSINSLLHDINMELNNIKDNHFINCVKSRLDMIESLINDDGIEVED